MSDVSTMCDLGAHERCKSKSCECSCHTKNKKGVVMKYSILFLLVLVGCGSAEKGPINTTCEATNGIYKVILAAGVEGNVFKEVSCNFQKNGILQSPVHSTSSICELNSTNGHLTVNAEFSSTQIDVTIDSLNFQFDKSTCTKVN